MFRTLILLVAHKLPVRWTLAVNFLLTAPEHWDMWLLCILVKMSITLLPKIETKGLSQIIYKVLVVKITQPYCMLSMKVDCP